MSLPKIQFGSYCVWAMERKKLQDLSGGSKGHDQVIKEIEADVRLSLLVKKYEAVYQKQGSLCAILLTV